MGSFTLLFRLLVNKTEYTIFVSMMCSLLPEDFHAGLIYLSSLQLVLCLVAAVKRLVHHHSADFIFSGSLGSF